MYAAVPGAQAGVAAGAGGTGGLSVQGCAQLRAMDVTGDLQKQPEDDRRRPEPSQC